MKMSLTEGDERTFCAALGENQLLWLCIGCAEHGQCYRQTRGQILTWTMYCLGVSGTGSVPKYSTTCGRLSMLEQPDWTNQVPCSWENCSPVMPCRSRTFDHLFMKIFFIRQPERCHESSARHRAAWQKE